MHNSRTPVQLNPTPSVGAHNEEVLNGLLGYSDAEVKELYSKEVIGNWDHYGETVTAKAE